MVYVNAGDNKGQQGKVLEVDPSKQRAIVEGVNLCKKATKPGSTSRICRCSIRRAASLLVSAARRMPKEN